MEQASGARRWPAAYKDAGSSSGTCAQRQEELPKPEKALMVIILGVEHRCQFMGTRRKVGESGRTQRRDGKARLGHGLVL